MSKDGREKGTFGEAGLPNAEGYLRPGSHGRLLAFGLGLGFVAVGLVALLLLLPRSRNATRALVSAGPLSSAHAVAGEDCASCHDGFSGVRDEACASCHESPGEELGLYGFAAHYVYRSGDRERLTSRREEVPCASCHPEHRGKSAAITEVVDGQCLVCHEGTRFVDDHPQFAALASPRSDDDALAFAHGAHVRRVMERLDLGDPERACLACHEADAAGRGFGPIAFDRHCDACHLDAGVATPRLPLESAGETVGVRSLEAIRASGEPGSHWSLFADPGELRVAGPFVSKSPIHHRDPWILDNLRRLRHLLYPDAGLADLLVTAPEGGDEGSGDEDDLRELYLEMVETLEDQIVGLRGSSDSRVQQQLRELERILAAVRRALDDPAAPLDESALRLALDRPAELPADEREEIEDLVATLVTPCSQCHELADATIRRVRENQRTMVRAEFDHRGHVLQRGCLDCHDRIPIRDALAGRDLPPEVDAAAIHDLPGIDSCRDCHRPRRASTACTTCHLFHPDRERRAGPRLLVGE